MLAGLPPARDRSRLRLWVDRSFSIRGAGTVVTGGLTDGPLQVGDEVGIVGDGGLTDARIRSIEALGEAREEALPGGRAAINLARVDYRRIRRGDALVRRGDWHLSDTIDVELRVAPTLAHAVPRRGAFTAHIGTSSLPVPVRLIGAAEIVPGGARPGAAAPHPPAVVGGPTEAAGLDASAPSGLESNSPSLHQTQGDSLGCGARGVTALLS